MASAIPPPTGIDISIDMIREHGLVSNFALSSNMAWPGSNTIYLRWLGAIRRCVKAEDEVKQLKKQLEDFRKYQT